MSHAWWSAPTRLRGAWTSPSSPPTYRWGMRLHCRDDVIVISVIPNCLDDITASVRDGPGWMIPEWSCSPLCTAFLILCFTCGVPPPKSHLLPVAVRRARSPQNLRAPSWTDGSSRECGRDVHARQTRSGTSLERQCRCEDISNTKGHELLDFFRGNGV